ncbi:D-alanyl-D-alanine carboxypeptidase family protein [Oscillospiraceae bacterium WX1]
MFKKFVTLLLMLLFLPALPAAAISAKGYALIEMTTGRLVTGQNVDLKLPMASTTKIMTGLLACESGMFDMVVTVPPEAARVEGSSIYLQPGEKLTLRELTYGLLLESGNDAATAVAIALGGTVDGFAAMMNEKAAELGLQNTHFMNPSGLDGAEHYTTALDLARLGAAAMKNDDFKKIVSTYKTRIPYNGIENGRLLINHNEMLNIYNGAIGIKTGYTKKSGRCLVTCAARDGVTLVAATLNGHDDWGDHTSLLNEGFQKLRNVRLFAVRPVLTAAVAGGACDSVQVTSRDNPTAALASAEVSRIQMHLSMRRFTYAPIVKGQKMGEIVWTLNGDVLARAELIALDSVAPEKPNRLKGFLKAIF